MDVNLFAQPSNDGEGVRYYISPAGRLELMNLADRQREKIINCFVNEAIAARELIKMTPDGTGGMILSPREGITEDVATSYGQAVLNTNGAFQGTGRSHEMLRD